MPRVQPEILRDTLVQIYGEAAIARLEAAAGPANDNPPADPVVIADEAEAARFAAEVARDAAMGDAANWPHE